MTIITKILLTISCVLGILLTWVTISKAKVKHFIESVKQAASDGKIEAEEALELIIKFIGIFKP